MPSPDLLNRALARPEGLRDASLEEWDFLIRQARAADLLGRLHAVADAHDTLGDVPEAPRTHLRSVALLVAHQHQAVRREVHELLRALAPLRIPLILLKGAAYVAAELPVAQGRLLSDIDILVPKATLPDVEAKLMLHGWSAGHHDEYDQRYYRRWMHELPPMRHIRRGTVIDVHHALLPETARIRADSERMRAAAIPVAGHAGAFVLAPEDMLLHSATHLFHEGEFDHGLRDLVDLDGLIRHFGESPTFWRRLPERAREVGLGRPLFYALRYSHRLLDSPVPASVLEDSMQDGPPPFARSAIDGLFVRALRAPHSSCADRWTPAALFLLYVRSHWLRMPLHLLAYHLARKAIVRARPKADAKR